MLSLTLSPYTHAQPLHRYILFDPGAFVEFMNSLSVRTILAASGL
jgi:hypothetical protein